MQLRKIFNNENFPIYVRYSVTMQYAKKNIAVFKISLS